MFIKRTDFDLAALHHALDAQHQARGITWEKLVREINRNSASGVHPIARSTVAGLPTKAVAEGDGILQMLRWLNRSQKSFVPGFEESDIYRLPDAPPGRILRFDTSKLYAAIDLQRIARGLTWQQAASEIGGIGAASLTHLKLGGRTGFPGVMRITRWLARPAAHFVRIADR